MKILLIEDNETDAYIFIRGLKEHEVHWCKSKTASVQLMEVHGDFDLIVTDYLGVDAFYEGSPSFEHLEGKNFIITSSVVVPQGTKHADKFVTKDKLVGKINNMDSEG